MNKSCGTRVPGLLQVTRTQQACLEWTTASQMSTLTQLIVQDPMAIHNHPRTLTNRSRMRIFVSNPCP
eukprot:1382541-Amphidinium_carterae.1